MLELLLSIFCSTLIVVLFKIYSRQDINLFQTIVINYMTCFSIGLLLEPQMLSDLKEMALQLGMWMVMALGVIFILGFNLIGLTVKHFGLSVASVFQKLPFIASAFFGIVWYQESTNTTKLIGLGLCVIAVILTYKPSDSRHTPEHKNWHWLLPILTFATGAIIEIVFFIMKKESLWSGSNLSLTAMVFGFAGLFGLVYGLFSSAQRFFPRRRSLIAGILLGIPNFFSIYLLLRLLSRDWEGSVVFPANNIGILFLSGLIGLFYFKEKLSLKNIIGLLLSLIGITIILLATR